MKKIFYPLILTGLLFTSLQAEEGFLGAPVKKIHVNNCVLSVVNGKPISVVDVMKKMEIDFFQQFPEYASSADARYQYFVGGWRRSLQDLIDKELIIQDAIDNNIPVSNGDIRQEMESLFGPNIIANLDKLGMTYDEAFESVKGDIILRRMLYHRVNVKTMHRVTPQLIRETYNEHIKTNQKPAKWDYQVVSIRHPENSVGAQLADMTHDLLTKQEVELGTLGNTLSPMKDKDMKVSISQEFSHEESEISPAYLGALSNLKPGAYSDPITQTSRADKSTVYRIFYLKDKIEGGVPSFKEVEKEITNNLYSEISADEQKKYLKRLRTHYAIHESNLKQMVEDGFVPFTN